MYVYYICCKLEINSLSLSLSCMFQIAKGKYHGTVDIGLSVLTYKRHGRRIDIDAEDVIYHLKVGQGDHCKYVR